MILHTIVPFESIFPAEEQNDGKILHKQIGAVMLSVKRDVVDDRFYEIIRIESSNPQDYLDFYPGQKIRL